MPLFSTPTPAVSITKLAERTITDDLEYLISKAVDPSKADYAVVTGVQIHNWGTEFDADSPNMEWVAPMSGESGCPPACLHACHCVRIVPWLKCHAVLHPQF